MSAFLQRQHSAQNSHLVNPARLDYAHPRYAPAWNPFRIPQSAMGNQAMQRRLRTRAIQTKLTINQPGDKYEQEADLVSENVLRMLRTKTQSVSTSQNSPYAQGEDKKIKANKVVDSITPLAQRQTADKADVNVDPVMEEKLQSLPGGGKPLILKDRKFFEQGFGYDFSQVRVHTDSKANDLAHAINARAFTIGDDLVFRSGEYQPTYERGQRLLAHELTHVAQQQQGIGKQGPTIISAFTIMRQDDQEGREHEFEEAQEEGVDVDPDSPEPADVDTSEEIPCSGLKNIQSNLSLKEENNWRSDLEDMYPRLRGNCYRVLREGGDNCCGHCQSRFNGGDLLDKGTWLAIPDTVEGFENMFKDFEPIEKSDSANPSSEAVLALYALDGTPTHTACRSWIQYEGKFLWESKLSEALPLIIHSLEDIEDGPLGTVVKMYKRKAG